MRELNQLVNVKLDNNKHWKPHEEQVSIFPKCIKKCNVDYVWLEKLGFLIPRRILSQALGRPETSS